MATRGIFFCAIYLVVARVVLAAPPLIKESRNSPDGSGELPGHIRNPLDKGAEAPKLADEGIFPVYDYSPFDGNINKVKDVDFDDESVPPKNNNKDEDEKKINEGEKKTDENEVKTDEEEKKFDEAEKFDEEEKKFDEEEKVDEEEKKFDEEKKEKVDEEEMKFDEDENKFDEENKFDKDEKFDEEKKIDEEEKKFDDDEKKLDEDEMKIDRDEEKFNEDKTKINEDEKKINDGKKDEDDKNINDSKEDAPFHGGFIFDTPFFNTRQVSKYFHQLEKALEHVFREAADEASFLNGTFANTTEEEVDIDGQKYLVQKSVIQGKDKDSSIYVEALSSIPKTNTTEGVSEL